MFDAGSHEMNMGIIHALGQLYRETGNERYLRMAREVLKDFERAGDYYRTGLAGREYFRTPRPRWESLHSVRAWSNCIASPATDLSRRLPAPLGQHPAFRPAQHGRLLVGRTSHRQSVPQRRHRNVLRDRVAGGDAGRPAADRRQLRSPTTWNWPRSTRCSGRSIRPAPGVRTTRR